MNLYDFTVNDREENPVSLVCCKGKVILIVNSATHCGFTPQYAGLQKLYEEFHDKGLEILDFPCNQFGKQAPGTAAEICEFRVSHYHTTFPQFAKIEVNGANASPLYVYLKQQLKGICGSNIKWNFTKFLIDKNGNAVKRYGPNKTPQAIAKDVEAFLNR
ncbi:glutathione peroxidase [Leadbettera azotonutricia]|uniref:Glutathione peroxidase n=1 Tax=Leadbettera azotonutricia (strain ATCC BAA-888 / DSM 13862 / ZAS-9) TaxID=545695 RepID=F5Y6V8_LEAAZ|nr:glutathione peroxidase [Leadbettera azotonutricia]AEF81582.1 glutathione peroxidase [Leadbettera azotonutricia ZAS-9]